MKRLMLLAVVVTGCNYYGPDNPPPDVDAPPPTYRYQYVIADDVNGVAFAPCPAGSILVAGGGDCFNCTPAVAGSFLLGTEGIQTSTGLKGWAAACYPGCASAQSICLASSSPGTISQTPLVDEAAIEEIKAPFRRAREVIR